MKMASSVLLCLGHLATMHLYITLASPHTLGTQPFEKQSLKHPSIGDSLAA